MGWHQGKKLEEKTEEAMEARAFSAASTQSATE